jgi:hypothetical protein
MPASFRTKSGGDAVAAAKKYLGAFKPTAGDCLYAAERQRARIITRTGRGIDAEGRPFAPYKEKYAERKSKTGRDSGIVDLNWSGKMLQALVSRSGAREIGGRPNPPGLNENPEFVDHFLIGVYGEEAKRAAAINGGQGHQPERRFIAASRDDNRAMAIDVVARMKARANGTAL